VSKLQAGDFADGYCGVLGSGTDDLLMDFVFRFEAYLAMICFAAMCTVVI
jgi:hypothetical protein